MHDNYHLKPFTDTDTSHHIVPCFVNATSHVFGIRYPVIPLLVSNFIHVRFLDLASSSATRIQVELSLVRPAKVFRSPATHILQCSFRKGPCRS